MHRTAGICDSRLAAEADVQWCDTQAVVAARVQLCVGLRVSITLALWVNDRTGGSSKEGSLSAFGVIPSSSVAKTKLDFATAASLRRPRVSPCGRVSGAKRLRLLGLALRLGKACWYDPIGFAKPEQPGQRRPGIICLSEWHALSAYK
jgi:hypothetical protein